MMRSQNWRQHLHSQLSKAQKEAVMHKDGPMMVLAGPGSGKTLVITKRIQYLISHYQIPPQRILVITFTRAAANEMKERFWRLAGKPCRFLWNLSFCVFTILKYAYHYSADNILPEHKNMTLSVRSSQIMSWRLMMKQILCVRSYKRSA